MSHTKFVAVVLLLASAVVQANQCSLDGECPSAALQNGVSLLQTHVIEDVEKLARVEVEMPSGGGWIEDSGGAAMLLEDSQTQDMNLLGAFQSFSGWSPDLKSHVWFYSHRSCSQDSFDSCNAHFKQQMRDVMEAARQSGIEPNHTFTHSALPDYLMNNPKWKAHVEPGVRGRGFWFWKPALANHLLAQTETGIKDGDILIYVDGDGSGKVEQLAALSGKDSGSWDIVANQQGYCEYQFTKGDIFETFGVKPQDPHYGKTQQYRGDNFAMRINKNTRKFLRMWEELVQDLHLVSDEPSISRNADSFRCNRHDQSMYSMLLKASLEHNGACKTGETIQSEIEELTILPTKMDSLVKWKTHEKFGISGLRVMIQ